MTVPMTARDRDLTCHEVIQLVTDYLEGALSQADRRRFEDHIRGCDGCDGYIHQMRTAIRLTGRIAPESVAPEARERLMETFREWKTTPAPAPDGASLFAKLRKLFKR